jgi:serine/threonine protein kinase
LIHQKEQFCFGRVEFPFPTMAGHSWIRGKLIGAGTFGAVNLAIDREDGEVFAVKSVEVNGRDAGAQVSLQALENEIQLLQTLDSKYVVRCLGSDWTEESGKLMRNLFLEYMPEGSLADFLKQFAGAGALDEHLIRTYTRSIVEGIDYLHREGIVHCDIKGKNLLVRNGNVKLTDFGSAKRVGMEGENEAMNCSAKVNGTPLWMAPEVVRQVEQGLPSDIWSLGCTVIEMATGRAPWSNLTNSMVALYHIGCTDELPEMPASLSAEAHDFLGKCFQRDPRKRWTSSQLLHHPFLTTRFVAKAVAVADAPLSPCSVMQFPHYFLASSVESSVPILSMPSFLKRGLVCEEPNQKSCQEQSVENCWGSSPFNDFAGEWIVVRSPKGSPPSSPSFSNLMLKCSVSPMLSAMDDDKTSVATPYTNTGLQMDHESIDSSSSCSSINPGNEVAQNFLGAQLEGFKTLEVSVDGLLEPSARPCRPIFLSTEEAGHCSRSSDAFKSHNTFQGSFQDCEFDRHEPWIPLQEVRQCSFGASLSMCKKLYISQLHWNISVDVNCRAAPSNHCTVICNINSPWVKFPNKHVYICVVCVGGELLCSGFRFLND